MASVVAADASAAGIAALNAGVKTAKGMKAIVAEARDLFRRPLMVSELKS